MGNDSTLNDYYLAHVIPTVVRISLLYGFLNRLFFNEYSLTIEFIHNSWYLNEYHCLHIPVTVTSDLVIVTKVIKIIQICVKLI